MPPPDRRQLMLVAALSLLSHLFETRPVRAEEAEKAGAQKQSFLPLGDFTVNLRGKTGQFEFVVVGVTLDVVPQAAGHLKEIMPRLKEALTRRLMALASRGALMPDETDPVMLKASLADALQKVELDGIKEVLITRLLYG